MSIIHQAPAPAPERPGPRRGSRGLMLALASSFAVAAVIVAVIVVLQRDETSVPVSTSPPDGSTSATVLSGPEQAVRDTVQHFYDARNAASRIPDPDPARLAIYATGPQLQADIEATRKLQDDGQATQIPPDSISEIRIQSVVLDGDSAVVTACRIDDGMVVDAETRIPVYDYPPGSAVTSLQSLELVRELDGWRVSGLTKVQRWEGVAGCAVAQ